MNLAPIRTVPSDQLRAVAKSQVHKAIRCWQQVEENAPRTNRKCPNRVNPIRMTRPSRTKARSSGPRPNNFQVPNCSSWVPPSILQVTSCRSGNKNCENTKGEKEETVEREEVLCIMRIHFTHHHFCTKFQ